MKRLRSGVKRILSSIRENEQNEISDNEDTTSNRILEDHSIQIVRESPISGQDMTDRIKSYYNNQKEELTLLVRNTNSSKQLPN